jgi:hypothetical protein
VTTEFSAGTRNTISVEAEGIAKEKIRTEGIPLGQRLTETLRIWVTNPKQNLQGFRKPWRLDFKTDHYLYFCKFSVV